MRAKGRSRLQRNRSNAPQPSDAAALRSGSPARPWAEHGSPPGRASNRSSPFGVPLQWLFVPRSGHPIFEPERPSLLRQPRLAQAIDQPVGVRRVAERYAGDMGCGRVSGVDVFQLAPHRGRVAPPAFSDRTRARRVWRLKSREFGRIPFNRLKVFNAFKEPSAKSDWYPSPRHYFAAEP